MKGLDARLREIRGYLDLVIDEKLPLNHEILYHLQVPFSLTISVQFLCMSLHYIDSPVRALVYYRMYLMMCFLHCLSNQIDKYSATQNMLSTFLEGMFRC